MGIEGEEIIHYVKKGYFGTNIENNFGSPVKSLKVKESFKIF